MSPRSKDAPSSRPPVRAKSALPAPRTAPKRVHVAWHQRWPVRILLALVALGVLAIIVTSGLRAWHHHTSTKHATSAVRVYDAQIQTQYNLLSSVFSQTTTEPTVPHGFLAGTVPQRDYVTQTAGWEQTLQTFQQQLVADKTPAQMQKAKGLIGQGVVVFTDAVRIYQLAATTTDATLRAALIQQGDNILGHAKAVFANGAQEEASVVHHYGLPLQSGITPDLLKQAPQIPSETTTATPAPATSHK